MLDARTEVRQQPDERHEHEEAARQHVGDVQRTRGRASATP